MKKISINEVRGIGLVSKISLVLLFTVMFSTFMLQGWYGPNEADAATYYTRGTGNWSATATWSTAACAGAAAAAYPGSGDTVQICTGNIVTVDVAAAAASITVNAPATNNGITISGTNTLTVTGAITMTAPVNRNSTIAVGTGTLSAASIAIPGGTLANRYCLVSVSTGTITTTGNITFSGTAAQARLTFTGAGTLNLGGNLSIGGTFAASTGTVNCNGSSAQTVGGYTYNVLKSNNPSGVTLLAASTIKTLTIGDATANSVFNDGGFVITPGAGSVLNLTGGTYNLGSATVGTAWPAWGTRNITAGTTVGYVSGVAQAVSITPSYPNLTFSGAGTKTTALGALTIAIGGNWSVGSTTALNTNNTVANLTGNLTGSGNISLGSGSHSIGGNCTNNGTSTAGSGTVTYNSAGAQTVCAWTYNNLTTSTGGTKTMGGTTTVNGTLTVGSGTTFDQGASYNLTAGNAGAGGITVASTGTFQNNGTGSITLGGNLTNDGTVSIDANGNGCNTADTKITVNGTATWSGDGAFQLFDVALSGQTNTIGTNIYVYNGLDNGGNSGFTIDNTCDYAPTPTAVKLKSFTATDYSDKVLIQWRTGHEVNNLGFNLYREEGGQLYRLTPGLVAGSALIAGPNIALTAGRSYTWWDDGSLTPQSLPDGRQAGSALSTAQYWLEDVDLSGKRTMYGPITPVVSDSPAPEAEQAALLSKLTKAQTEKGTTSASAGQSLQARVSKTPSAGAFQSLALGAAQKPQQVQWALAGASAVKIFVQKEGWYRLTQPELAVCGVDKADPRYLQLYVNGQEAPMVVNGQGDRNFGPLDSIEFYGKGIDTLYTDTQTYYLTVGTKLGKRVPQVTSRLRNQQAPSFPFMFEAKPRDIYFPALLNGGGNKIFGPFVSVDPNDPTVVKLNVRHPDPAPSGKAVLEVALQGVDAGPHTVSVVLNNYPVGQVTFSGQNQGTARMELTQTGLVQEGDNELKLIAQAGDDDASLVDTVRLTYYHTYTADDDTLRFTAIGGGQLSIGGFSSFTIRVVDITDPNAITEVKGPVKPGTPPYNITVTVPGKGTRILLAFTDAQIGHPEFTANNPSTWHLTSNGADMVVISHSDFLGALGPLKTFRGGQGLSVALIDVEDLYDEFSFGNKTPRLFGTFSRGS